MTLRFEHYGGLNNTPALDIAMEGHLALMRDGLAGNNLMLGCDDRAIVVFSGRRAAGVMTWHHDKRWNELQIILGYVRPWARKKGVAMLLWECLVETAQEWGVPRITSSTRVHNAPMRALAAKQGRKEVAVILEYDVPPAGDR